VEIVAPRRAAIWTHALTAAGIFGMTAALALVTPMNAEAQNNNAPSKLFYVGTYSPAEAAGIYVFRLDDTTGSIQLVGSVAGIENPSFLALSTDRTKLYSVSETSNGGIASFKIDPETKLPALVNKESSKGSYPCHLSVDKMGKMLVVANYGDGVIASYPLNSDGQIGPAASVIKQAGTGPNKARQEGPHAHFATFDTAGTRVFTCDLGADKIFMYQATPLAGTLAPTKPAFGSVVPGSGPRHLVFDATGRYAYVLNEMTATVTVFRYDHQSGFSSRQNVSALPADYNGENSGAEIVMHPSGRYLFTSNRGHDTVAVFAISKVDGKLMLKGHIPVGKTPRGFAIDPTGRWLVIAGQDDGSVRVFKFDAETGKATDTTFTATISKPVCVLF